MKHGRRSTCLGLLLGLIGLMAWTACESSGAIGGNVSVTYGVFDELPSTAGDARAEGWIELTEVAVDYELPSTPCVPNHGRHLVKPPADVLNTSNVTFAGTPIDPNTLLMNASGELIGIELASLEKQVVPPWEYSPKGHPDMDFEHWHMHVYFSDPSEAC